ncbi:ankyrin repeat protein [Aspergillus caelatus]|uniref:Ankyrin repeat protein n=1 Tax=Aspergillus caelatus TaxID=61420 RepID=A0A5N6ZW12_9EURO|nr:ankyrin repeat protein [Aspergillus caelatus]KAE8361129.1 ankyrin repeat protein [Aspergillus caelatus]
MRDTKDSNPTQDNTDDTPRMWAGRCGRLEAARLLIDRGADPIMRNGWGQAPLSWAAENGHQDVAKPLLDRGAKHDSQDARYHRTALHWASLNGHAHFVELLLKHGANPHLSDYNGQSPLDYARDRQHEHVVDALLAHITR